MTFDQPAAAAAFSRAGWLWLVFDKKTETDPKDLVRAGAGIVLDAQTVPVKPGSAMRLLVRPGVNPLARREGKVWYFDLSVQTPDPTNALDIAKQFDFEDRGRMVIKGGEPSKDHILIRDPEVGDVMDVVPMAIAGTGIAPGQELASLQLLPTAQGVAMVPKADGVRLDAGHGFVEITMPGGIAMSTDPNSGKAPKHEDVSHGAVGEDHEEPIPLTGPLEISKWLHGGPNMFEEEHQKLLSRLASSKPESRGPYRMEMARHYFANGMAAEAIGILRDASTVDPGLSDTAAFRGLRGAANYMMRRDAEAIADLSHPSLAQDRSAQTWLAAAQARSTGDLPRYAPAFKNVADDIKDWPTRLRLGLGRIAVESLTAGGDFRNAGRVADNLLGREYTQYDKPAQSYLSGIVAEAAKQYELATKKYLEAEDGPSRIDRAYAARNRIELQLRRGLITPLDASAQLEKLRYAWRTPDFEYKLLKRLGELQMTAGQFGNGLRLLHSLVENYGSNPDIPNVTKMMQDSFKHLFLDGAAEKLPPITAIGLFNEFQELTPPGDQGDEMIRKLADRLASVDLLEDAAALLRHQVNFRLSGMDKSRIGARLALLELQDRKAEQALDTLNTSEIPNEPAELYDQRRYMRVRALADLGRTGEALALIMNDPSDVAKKMRAEIYFDLKKWPEAAQALESLLDRPMTPRKLDPTTVRRVLDLATALTLAKDERGLQRLRHSYGQQMATSEFHEAFDLLTSEPEHGIPDYRRVDEKIKQVQDFQTFMGEWKNRIQSQGLSSIN